MLLSISRTLRAFLGLLTLSIFFVACHQNTSIDKDKKDHYDGPGEMWEQELEMIRDPRTGQVPWQKLFEAKLATETAREAARQNRINALSWEERGPNADAVGPSNGNTRANGGITAGRVRALMVDSLDPNKKTVFAGSVSGGLWKTTDITATPAIWTPVNDFLSNLAISSICQDPRPGFRNNMYLSTGESYFNADAAQGVGVFKSTDGGTTWTYLASTSAFTFCTRILCDFQGNVYLGTRNGLYRSNDGGSSWTGITPSGLASSRVCDMEISSTATQARLHVVTGISNSQAYRYTDDPAGVSTGSGWNAPTTPFPSYNNRAEIAVLGSVLYALPVNNSSQIPEIYKSVDGGATWAITPGAPPNAQGASSFANGQGWYDVSVRINPANSEECIIGGIDCARTLDGGTTWTRISAWVGTSSAYQYVHADQHDIQWWDGGNKLIFGCDGGVHYSSDKGTTIRDRNTGFRVKQFYAVAVHPTQTNYFLAGAQDNGVHQLNNPGLGASVEVTGGDGAYVAIDQNEANYQFGSYVYNVYRRSANNGANWSSFSINSSSGRFINPWDYDNQGNMIYACNAAGNYLRWENPQTAANAASAITSVVPISEFAGQNVSAVHVSPFTANRVFFGMGAGKVIRVSDAQATTPTAADITPAGASGYVNCVNTGSSESKLIAVYSSYNVNNVWVSQDGGATWTQCDGNLPNMPVRWAIFHPDTDTKAIIATETGVWETDLLNGTSTVWEANPSFPNVRVSMLKYRALDRTLVAATYGRGVWSATIPAPSGFSFNTPAAATAACPAPQNMSITLNTIANGGFTGAVSLAATGNPVGTTVSFTTNPVTPGNSTIVILNGTNTLLPGTYNVTVNGTATGAVAQSRILTFTITAGTAPVIASQPSDITVCSGNNASFTVLVNEGAYQWQVSTNGGTTFSNISGATNATYTVANATAIQSGNLYRCVVSNTCGNSVTTTTALLTVANGTTITTQPANASLCVGGSNIFRVVAVGAGLSYQWQISTNGGTSFSDITGATSSLYTLTGITLGMNGNQYRCIVNGTCAPTTATSTVATLSVVSALSITQQPQSQTVCAGTDAGFSVVAQGVSTYQWQISTDGGATWSGINGATNTSYTVAAPVTAQSGNQYRCVVSGSCGTGNTNAATLTVNPITAITQQPNAQIICAGTDVSFSVTATGAAITYQWQQSVNGCNGPWTNITGATNATYSITNAGLSLNNTAYRCVVNGTCTAALTSGCGLLTVVAPATVVASPVSQTVCDGAGLSFAISGGGTNIIYQWQVNTGAGFVNLSNGGIYSGVNTASLTIAITTPSMSSYQYRCLVSNTVCATPTASAAATLTVNTLPAISTQPQSQTICEANSMSFTTTASGTGVQYQWQVNTGAGFINLSNGAEYSGVNSNSLTIVNPTVAMSGYQYRCVVSGTCAPTVNSAVATLTVHAPVVINRSPASAEVCAGTTANFLIAASSVPAINYQWQVSTNGGTTWTDIPGATASNLSLSSVIIAMNGNRYRCMASNNTCTRPVVSAAALLTVRLVPTIGLSASSLTSLLPGQTTTLTATPSSSTGGVITTNWTQDNLSLTPTTPTTFVANVNSLGVYQVGIRETWPSGLFCSALSSTVTLTANVSSRLFIFPSPNDGNFTVSYYYGGSGSANRQLMIYDGKGARVYREAFSVSGPYTLLPVNLQYIARGIYYVVIGDANGNKLIEGKVHVR